MDAAKKKRLITAGWKIGSVSEFLGLSKDEEDSIELKLRLSEKGKGHNKEFNTNEK